MSRSFRLFGVVALVLLIAIGVALYYFASNADAIVENLIEEHGSAATGTAVRVDGVSLNLRGATGVISGLTVASPDGFGDEPAIEFGRLELRLDAGSLLDEPIVVNNVDVEDAVLRIEQAGSRNNLQVLLDNLRGDAPEPAPEPEAAGPRVVIERFALTGANATLSVPDLDERRSLEVPDIVLTDIGAKSGGATGAELARQVLEPLLREVLKSTAAQSVKERVREELEERAGGLLDRLGIGDEDDEAGEEPAPE